MLKKSLLVVALLVLATNLWAAKVLNVTNTRHNFGSNSPFGEGTYRVDNTEPVGLEDEVCIYCHTPHGGAASAPLWNRVVTSGAGFTHYTSATLSNYMKGAGMAGRDVNPESMLCMACHDGTTGMNAITNYSNRTGAPNNDPNAKIQAMFDQPGAAIGDIRHPTLPTTMGSTNNISDDHPISFSYYQAWLDPMNDGRLNDADGVAGNDPRAKGVRLFGDQASEQRVECSTCHDPHVDYGVDTAYTPFLVMSNAGSNLCLACHIK